MRREASTTVGEASTTVGEAPCPSPSPPQRSRPGGGVIAAVAALAWLVLASLIHLQQGTASIDVGTLLAAAFGDDLPQATAVLVSSRLPRLLAAVFVGVALGIAGAALQSVLRNPLASPDTLGVGAGASVALTIVTVLGVSLGAYGGVAVAFAGGLLAAVAVIGLSTGGALSPMRLVLAGSVLALGLSSLSSALLILFPWETQGLFAWGAGSLSQNGPDTLLALLPLLIAGVVLLLFLGRRLDLLQLGDDAAASFGLRVTRTRLVVVIAAVALTAASVTVAGPIGFVGLCAPALLRVLTPSVPALRHQRVFVGLSAIVGVALLLTADVALRALFGGAASVAIPTGVVTSLIGAVFLIVMAQRLPSGRGDGESLASMMAGSRWGRAHPVWVISLVGAVLLAAIVAAVLLGDRLVLLGDVGNWLQGRASTVIDITLGSRVPRVAGALLAGAGLALAGVCMQAVTRNPLAEPGILGVSASAGLGAVVVITLTPATSDLAVFAAALVMAAMAAGFLAIAGRGGQLRLILVGVGIGAGASALTTLAIVRTDPFNQTLALTWLGGSTYGTRWALLIPLALMVLAGALGAVRWRRELDLLQFDEVTPQVLGVDVPRFRLACIAMAAGLSAAATAGIGVIGFVGLIAPHAARMLVGKRHAVMVPLAMVLGGALVVVSDLVGRAVIAPAQLPAGMLVALIGTPYFLWLLHRMRTS